MAALLPRAAQLLPPVLAAFLSCLFIVIRPLASLAPPYAFLILTIQILYFYPSGTLVAQVESAALAFAGALVSLGYANFFLWFAVLANRTVENAPEVPVDAQDKESVWARLACALGLAFLAITTGWIRSKSPRLMNAARIMLFHGVWLLVDTSNIQKMSSSYFLDLFYPTLFAMLVSLLSTIIGHWLIPPTQSSLRDLMREAIDAVQHEIQVQVAGALPNRRETPAAKRPSSPDSSSGQGPLRPVNLPLPISQARLLNTIPSRSLPALTPLLRNLYNARRHSFTYAPLGPTEIRPFLITLGTRIGRNPVAKGGGKTRMMHPPSIQGKLRDDSTTYASDKEQLLPPLPFQTSLPGLADTMCQALAICARTVDDTYNWSDFARRRQHNLPALVKQFTRPPSSPPGHNETRNINSREQLLAIQHDLESCVAEYETDLLIWLDTDVFSSSATSSNTSTAKCPVAKVSLADMPTASTSARAMMFEQKLQQHATLPGHAGLNNNRRAKIRKTHEARLKATSWLVAMLDLSSDILQLVSTSLQLVERADERGFTDKGMRRSRLWLPKLGKHWLFKAPNKGRLVDDMGASSSAVQKQAELESAEREEGEDVAFIAQHRLARTLTRDERVKHLQRQEDDRRADIAADKAHASEQGELKGRRQPRRRSLASVVMYRWKRLKLSCQLWWTSERSLQRRIRLSKWISSAKHSKHNHYAFKMALGVMLLALPGFLPLGTSGRNWFTESRGQWAVISYLYVLDITTGATFRVGIWRLIGTISGAIVGYVGYLIARGTAYGLTAIATLSSLPIAWIMLYSTYPGIGIVAGITLPPILFIPYLQQQPYSQVIFIALWRAEQVAVGIIAAFLINSFIFPYHARVRYFHALATTLDRLAELYLTMSRDNLRPSLVYSGNVEVYTTLEHSIESGIGQCQSLAQIQHLEVSLLPKPYKLHLRLNQSLSRILELLVEIKTLRLSIPRRETVLDVLPLRQDLVSSVYITLFAIGHASRSRSPLPQFLPSPREALNKWGKAVEKLLGDSRPPSGTQSPVPSDSGSNICPRGLRASNAMDLAALYAFAEREALSQLCDALDETVEIARGLFGIQAFLEPKMIPTQDQEEDL